MAENHGGRCVVRVAENLMSAEVDLHPSKDGTQGFTISDILTSLGAAGVSWGINEEALKDAVLRCLTDHVPVEGFVAAQGLKPKKSVPSYWHLKKRLITRTQADPDAVRVDYREMSPYVLVKKGEPLARRVPAAGGEPGRNIAGDILPAGEKDIVNYRPGGNVIEKDGILYAAAHGRFELNDRIMSVNETLELKTNVDYSTGHIAFPGDVIIHGDVRDGFRVAAGKSIFVKQTMDASKVLAHGGLSVEGGIKGRTDALVRVGGTVHAKFVENVLIECHGDIIVEKSVMHSSLLSLGTVNLGEHGTLIGGEVWAAGGCLAGRIGRPESTAVSIRIGSNYVVDRSLKTARSQIERLEDKLEKLEEKGALDERRQNLVTQGRQALNTMMHSEKELMGRLHPRLGSKLTVFGRVETGTEILMGDLSLKLTSPMDNVTFYYDTDGPRIAARAVIEQEKALGRGTKEDRPRKRPSCT